MFSLPEHTIAFEGLKERVHDFVYEVGDSFFELIANEEIPSGKLSVSLQLDKRSSMMVAAFDMEGQISTTCDRCNGWLEFPVAGELKQIFKTAAREEYDNEEVVLIASNKHELNVTNSIYECLMLALPIRRVHEDGACDQEVLKALVNEEQNQEKSSDPRWNALRGLAK